MLTIDTLSYHSRLRYVHGGEKCAFSLATLFICVWARSISLSLFILFLNSLITLGWGRIPWKTYGKLLTIPLVFLLLSTLAIIVNVSHSPLDAYALSVGSWYITGSRAGLLLGAQLILTSLAAVSCLYFLSLNTTMTDILLVLGTLHCPNLIREIMLLIYRFIFILLSLAADITISQRSRMGNRNLRTSYHSFGAMVSVLFIRTIKQANTLFDAMESRCYDGVLQVLDEQQPPLPLRVFFIIMLDLLLLVLGIWLKMKHL